MGTEGSIPGVKQLERHADYSPSSDHGVAEGRLYIHVPLTFSLLQLLVLVLVLVLVIALVLVFLPSIWLDVTILSPLFNDAVSTDNAIASVTAILMKVDETVESSLI
jgi:uncharacterized membrane protein